MTSQRRASSAPCRTQEAATGWTKNSIKSFPTIIFIKHNPHIHVVYTYGFDTSKSVLVFFKNTPTGHQPSSIIFLCFCTVGHSLHPQHHTMNQQAVYMLSLPVFRRSLTPWDVANLQSQAENSNASYEELSNQVKKTQGEK